MPAFIRNPTQWSGSTQGIVLILLMTLASAGMSAAGKALVEHYATIQVLFFRCLFGLILTIAWARYRGWSINLKSPNLPAHFVRGSFNIISLMLYFGPMAYLSLAEAVALSYTQPLFAAALAILMLQEHVSIRRWIAIIVGFCGMLIILRPGVGTEHWIAQLLCVVSSMFWAVSLVLTRRLTATESSTTIVFHYLFSGAILSGLALPFYWVTPTASAWVLLVLLGVTSFFSQFLMTEAYRRAPASLVSPFFYATLLWTTGIGYIAWDEIPDRYVFAGSVVLLCSGVYLAIYGTPRLPEPAVAAEPKS